MISSNAHNTGWDHSEPNYVESGDDAVELEFETALGEFAEHYGLDMDDAWNMYYAQTDYGVDPLETISNMYDLMDEFNSTAGEAA